MLKTQGQACFTLTVVARITMIIIFWHLHIGRLRKLRDFRLPLQCQWDLRSSGISHSVESQKSKDLRLRKVTSNGPVCYCSPQCCSPMLGKRVDMADLLARQLDQPYQYLRTVDQSHHQVLDLEHHLALALSLPWAPTWSQLSQTVSKIITYSYSSHNDTTSPYSVSSGYTR